MFGWFKRKQKPETLQPDISNLVPRFKTEHFITALKRTSIPADQMPLTQPYVADLYLTYAFDLRDTFMMAGVAVIAEMGLNAKEAREVASANLRRQLPEIGVVEDGQIHRVVTGANLEACTLLISDFWKQVQQELGNQLVAVVPSRDVVLFCDGSSPEAVSELRTKAAEICEEGGTHALSTRLLTWKDDAWFEYAP